MKQQPYNLIVCSRESWSMAERPNQLSRKGEKVLDARSFISGKPLRLERIMTLSIAGLFIIIAYLFGVLYFGWVILYGIKDIY
jgi:hypothetical protein